MPSSYVIGEHFKAFIKDQVQQDRCASAGEVVRDGLRALEDREKLRALKQQALRDDIQRGAESGPGIPARKAFADVRKRINAAGTRPASRGAKRVVSPAAQADLMDIAVFIAQDNPKRALSFVDELEDRWALLATAPGIGTAPHGPNWARASACCRTGATWSSTGRWAPICGSSAFSTARAT